MIFNPQLKLATHERFAKFINGEIVNPIGLEVSLTGRCNANCEECFYKDKRENVDIKYKETRLFLLSFKERGGRSVTWTGGGEPTLHPEFDNFVGFAYGAGLEQGLFTNAIKKPCYDTSKMAWIRVSKTNLDWPEENIKMLRDKNPNVGLCINYKGRVSDKDIDSALKIAHKYDLRYVNVRPALNVMSAGEAIIYGLFKTNPKLIITYYKFNEMDEKRNYKHCYGFSFVPFVWHDGDYDVCAYHRKDPGYNIGNIYNDDLMQRISLFGRSAVVQKNCQKCCKNHEINKLVNSAFELEDRYFV